MYCERCNRLADREKCPGCGRKDLRMPRYDDFCFLAEPDALWVQALTDLLQDNGVEYLTRRVHGTALVTKTGIPQRVRFFVPYRDYQKAKELHDAFFGAEFVFEEE